MKLINWIGQNKEWLFSGVGVVIILAFIKLFSKRKTVSTQGQNNYSKKTKPFIAKTESSESFASSSSEITYSSNPKPLDIVEKIKKLPPFQATDVAKSYIGLAVEWETTFQTLHLLETNIARLMLNVKNNYPWIYCNVDIRNYPKIKITEKGAKVIVKGIITNVHGHDIQLKDAKIQILN